ncbi:MAG: hypothetical protein K0S32_4596 [Bacteroidetes bacterium]|nr:hypothetical protein [Bacteroidota bacterium]
MNDRPHLTNMYEGKRSNWHSERCLRSTRCQATDFRRLQLVRKGYSWYVRSNTICQCNRPSEVIRIYRKGPGGCSVTGRIKIHGHRVLGLYLNKREEENDQKYSYWCNHFKYYKNKKLPVLMSYIFVNILSGTYTRPGSKRLGG